MRNPIANVPSDKRPMFLGAAAAATILAVIFLLSPNSYEENPEETREENQKDNIVSANNPPPTPSPDASENIAKIAGSQSKTSDIVNKEPEPQATVPVKRAYEITPPEMFDKDKTASKRPTEELKMIQQLNARLKETEQSLQQLQIDRNKLIQDKLRSDDQLQRRQDEVEQLKATMEKIIEDNYREGEQMTQEIEYWRQQALTAKRQNASLADRRNSNPNPPPARLQLVPAAPSNPAAAPRQPLPLQLQMPQQPQQPQQPQPPPQPPPQAQTIPQAAPPNDFTTTCYDPDRGYFPCTVRQ